MANRGEVVSLGLTISETVEGEADSNGTDGGDDKAGEEVDEMSNTPLATPPLKDLKVATKAKPESSSAYEKTSF